MIIYLIPLARNARLEPRSAIAGSRRDATIPEDQRTGCPPSVLSCTAWGFSCLANYSASGELLPRLFTLTCASLPKNRRCLFCDTFRQPRLTPRLPACFTRHAAVWCSDFPLANPQMRTHQRSSAIERNLSWFRQLEKPETNQQRRKATIERIELQNFLLPLFLIHSSRKSFDHPSRNPIVVLPRST